MNRRRVGPARSRWQSFNRDLFPAQGAWTKKEYLALDTNQLVELSNSEVEMIEMSTIFHQIRVVRLIGV